MPKNAAVAQMASPTAAPRARLRAGPYCFLTALWNTSRLTGPMGMQRKKLMKKQPK